MEILEIRYDMGEMLRSNPGLSGIGIIRNGLQDRENAAKIRKLSIGYCLDKSWLDGASQTSCCIYSRCRWIKFMVAHTTGNASYMHTLNRCVFYDHIICSPRSSIPQFPLSPSISHLLVKPPLGFRLGTLAAPRKPRWPRSHFSLVDLLVADDWGGRVVC